MRNHNDNDANYLDFSSSETVKRIDPFRARVLASYTRQVEMARFLRAAFGTVRDWLAAWNRRGGLIRELNAKPDYILKDIGIRRDQIDAVASGRLKRETAPIRPVVVPAPSTVAGAKVDDQPVKPLAA